MKLEILEDEEFSLGIPTISVDEQSRNAMGGSEIMKYGLYERLPNELKDKCQIIVSRVRAVDPNRPSLLWLHDTWEDPEAQHLKNSASRARFAKLIFVSQTQFQSYHLKLGVPYRESIIIRNAIDPIPQVKKDTNGPIRLIYHTTPHRGLELLVPVFEKIYEAYPNIHLDVFSSFKIYGWPQRDVDYEEVFQRCRDHPCINYHGYQPNDVVRKYLQQAHIFAYPSIWPETSCIAAIEAMSAGCVVVCPNLAALPETTASFADMYHWTEEVQDHAQRFANQLYHSIQTYYTENNKSRLHFQKKYVDSIFSWDNRINEWVALIRNI